MTRLLRPRTRAAIARSQAAGIPVARRDRPDVPVRAALPRGGGDHRAGRLLPGRGGRRPVSGEFLLHEPIPSRRRARRSRLLDGARATRRTATSPTGSTSTSRPSTRACTPSFQHLPVEEVGDLATWLEAAADEARRRRRPRRDPGAARDGRCPVRRAALPHDLAPVPARARQPRRLEGHRARVRRRTGSALASTRVVAFGDGENDIELIEEAGFGIAVEDGNPLLLERADWVCPGAEEEGVAAVIDALPRLHAHDRPQGRPRRAGRLAGGPRPQGRRRARSTSCSPPTSAGARSCRASTSYAARRSSRASRRRSSSRSCSG